MFLWMIIFTAILVTITTWFGAEVVYRYGIGVQSLPKSTGVGHQHSHVSSPVDATFDSKSFLQKNMDMVSMNTKIKGLVVSCF